MATIADLVDAIISRRRDAFDRVMKTGTVDVNEIDDYGFPPLIEAAIVNETYFAEALLNAGAKVNKQDATGRTALHWACDNNNPKFAELLLRHGADPNIAMSSGQSALVFPLLRNQEKLKNVLYRGGADLRFAQNFINTKLLGHRFELKGQVHIPNHKKGLVLLDFEGFFLEFSVAVIFDSLKRFRHNFGARHLSGFFPKLSTLIDSVKRGEELIRYQHYMLNLNEYRERIEKIITIEPLFLPVTYRGHAISFVKLGDLLIKIDRGANSKREGAAVIYKIGYPQQMTKEFIFYLIYQQHSETFIHSEINELLGLRKVGELPLKSQVTGNCSWANVEGAIFSLMYVLLLRDSKLRLTEKDARRFALEFYYEWREWDKDRSLDYIINQFKISDKTTKASIASIIGAIFFQTCRYEDEASILRAEKMLPVIKRTEYKYIYQAYLRTYFVDDTKMVQRLTDLLDIMEDRRRV